MLTLAQKAVCHKTGSDHLLPDKPAESRLMLCCAILQIDGGGKMTLRVSDDTYFKHVDRWWSVMLPRLSKYLYSRGGPIIMAQVPLLPQCTPVLLLNIG